MQILIVEPFFGGSHKKWAEEFQKFSNHVVEIISLPGRHWKWRMFGGAVELAKQLLYSDFKPDLLIASDMLDLATFISLCRKKLSNTAISVYFHENQITYPWSPDDRDLILKRNNQYGFINYTSALAADTIFYNSNYHLTSFTESLEPFLRQFPDHRTLENIPIIKEKSKVLPLGMNLKEFDIFKTQSIHNEPVILWNHRWEYDKNPNLFFKTLLRLKEENILFKLIILGQSYSKIPAIFNEVKKIFAAQIIHFGYAKSFKEYAELLWQSDILPVTSNQDFFGGSVVEAIYCNCIPILPNRLTYPEHIPKNEHQDYFYKREDELFEKLKFAILNIKKDQKSETLKNFVSRYDWSNLAPIYDATFEKLIRTI
jgi:glycosyltransferase involved in cell wall biosynthesis